MDCKWAYFSNRYWIRLLVKRARRRLPPCEWPYLSLVVICIVDAVSCVWRRSFRACCRFDSINCCRWVYFLVHHYFADALYTMTLHSAQPPTIIVILVALILLLGSLISTWVAHNRSTVAFSILYMWIVRLGDAKAETVERHPNYLKSYLSKGGR